MSSMIKVSDLGKKYVIAHNQPGLRGYGRLSEDLSSALTWPLRVLKQGLFNHGHGEEVTRQGIATNGESLSPSKSAVSRREEFWALRDVDFEVTKGEVVGIIGRNGAGKSTLLKLLSRITEPSTGRIELRGRVASLLEVGTGFHPELTGRENIFLNGAVLGMSRAEIKRKFDEIVVFAEVEKFLDTPVKRYSSGMYVRLAFAVAAHLEPEILIVDEVLAVGDAEFQKKCLGKMHDVSKDGRTVLFVSHNMNAVLTLCNVAFLLDAGRLVRSGAARDVVSGYVMASTGRGHSGSVNQHRNLGSTWTREGSAKRSALVFEMAKCTLHGKQPDTRLEIKLSLCSTTAHSPAFIAIDIMDSYGTVIMQAIPAYEKLLSSKNRHHQLDVSISLPPLIPGTYSVALWTGSHYVDTLDKVDHALSFEITESPAPGRTFPHTRDHGCIVPHSVVELHQDSTDALVLWKS
jgi:lipopolysaccharide transport system ATP-binding protein